MPMKFSRSEGGLAAIALQQAVEAALDALAEQHGKSPGEWLDDIEAEAIRRLKGFFGEGISMETEVAAIKVGIGAIQAAFAGYKKRLTET